jgi:hypothetical protein
MSAVVFSIYFTDEDQQNIEKLKRSRPGVPLSRLIREMVAKEVALLEQKAVA